MLATGTFWTASAHIITAVIGSGVLSLAWSVAKLGWIAGPMSLLAFAIITYFTSLLLADCYRSTSTPSPTGTIIEKRNYTYMDAVRSNLGRSGTPYFSLSFVQRKAYCNTAYVRVHGTKTVVLLKTNKKGVVAVQATQVAKYSRG